MVELSADEAIARIRVDEARLTEMQGQMQAIARTIEELRLTRVTLEQLPEEETAGLIPIGGVLIPVKTNVSKVKVNLGAGVIVDKDREAAVEILKKREESMHQAMKSLEQAFERTRNDALGLRRKLEARQNPDVPVISG